MGSQLKSRQIEALRAKRTHTLEQVVNGLFRDPGALQLPQFMVTLINERELQLVRRMADATINPAFYGHG